MQKSALTFAYFLCTAENRSALVAVQDLAESLAADQPYLANPLLLHGPTGTGKTHLVSALAHEVSRTRTDLAAVHLTAADFTQTRFTPDVQPSEEGNAQAAADDSLFAQAREADLLIVEDLQHLHASAVGPFTELVDELLANGQQLVFTATGGPQQLREHHGFPDRLVNRLAAGMVVALQPLEELSRLRIMKEKSKHLNISDSVLAWLARHLTGGVRQLLGAISQLEVLAAAGQPLDLDAVSQQFQVQADRATVTLDLIARQVSEYFQVEPRRLCSRERWREVMVPRQVSMYLARQLTGLSLEQIGAYFGGRDHTTVLHACRKVEEALEKDADLSGAVRQLRAGLV